MNPPAAAKVKITEQSENVCENKESMLERSFFMPKVPGHC